MLEFEIFMQEQYTSKKRVHKGTRQLSEERVREGYTNIFLDFLGFPHDFSDFFFYCLIPPDFRHYLNCVF